MRANRRAASTAGSPSGTRRTLEPLPTTVTRPRSRSQSARRSTAALRHPQAGAVEDLEHREVPQHDGGRDRVVDPVGRGGVRVAHVTRALCGVEQVVGLVGSDHPGQPVRALGRPQAPARVVLGHTVTPQVAEQRPERGGLAGDRRTGEAPRVEVGEVAPEGPVVDGAGTGAAAPLGPGHELGHVVRVGVPGVGTDRHE